MVFKFYMRRNPVRVTGENNATLGKARGRLVVVSGFFALVYVMLAVRAFDLMVMQERPAPIDVYHQAVSADDVARGDVYDQNGYLLATTLQMASLFADPFEISEPPRAAKIISSVFPDVPYEAVLEKLESEKRFVWIKRHVTPQEQAAILHIGEPGLKFEYENVRTYPQGPLAAHLVGFANVDNQPQAGLEYTLSDELARGQDVRLTLDVRLQHILRRELQETLQKFEAKGGAGVIMDVDSGAVLAGVSLPDFNPHQVSGTSSDDRFNRLTLGVYELGSVFKIFSTAALFEFAHAPMHKKFDASKPLKTGRFKIHDYHAEDRKLSVPEVFMYSSNIGSALMGQEVGTENLKKFYEDLGLLSRMEFEVPELGMPLVPDPWGEVHTLTAAYGHGVATTPLQLAAAVSSVVNGGFVVRPRLIAQAEGEDRQAKIRVMSEESSLKMRKLLRLVVSDGTGKNADVPGFNVGGKTGTAEKPGAKGYDRKRLVSSFVGVFPVNQPRYVIFVMVDEPKGQKESYGYATGGWVAAPAVGNIVQAMASILGIQPAFQDDDRDYVRSLKRYVSDVEKGGHE